MNKEQKRLNITISFTDKNTPYEENKKIYDYVKKKPNSSYYIRELVDKDFKEKNKSKEQTCESHNNNVDISNFVNSMFDF